MAATNKIGLSKSDYKGAPTTLCQGCGHNSILSQIIAACYETDMLPEDIVKFSGIGCSSKAPTYMLDRSFGFNGLHGRMPALATGALIGDPTLTGLAMSGDGDSISIGMGQFKHVIRRNVPMVYIIANNGTYGLTKGQLSATSEVGLTLKKHGTNELEPIDVCLEAMASNATFVARAFAGNPKQVKTLIKAALHHNGTAILDIISPCVTFNNADDSLHSYAWGRENKTPIHDLSFIPARDEIMIEDFEEGTTQDVIMHDGSKVRLQKLERDYDPTDRIAAVQIIEEARANHLLLTGLMYISPDRPSLMDTLNLPEKPINRLTPDELRPSADTLETINAAMF
ncbi:MAG: 2-oxoacid:ferredoxin oxidoreductase subunit beta [Anaerolineae bacterium]|nr:2-oxoacid:ferredoxin oxidoreductase subunit beta [Anaerolineae bacterium]MBT7189608.1 2-oxoacid:ferredoxin oxidoreductase subunit beta [Anaerolineae bacterium]